MHSLALNLLDTLTLTLETIALDTYIPNYIGIYGLKGLQLILVFRTWSYVIVLKVVRMLHV